MVQHDQAVGVSQISPFETQAFPSPVTLHYCINENKMGIYLGAITLYGHPGRDS